MKKSLLFLVFSIFTFTSSVFAQNQLPTAITLSALTVDENLAIDTEVGAFTTTDADDADTFTYTLVSGTGDTDNASFTISGDKLLTAASFDFETKASYEVRIETNDGTDVFSDTFTISVNDVFENQIPTAITLSALTVDENSAVGTEVGVLTTTDADVADTFTYTLVSGTGDIDNASFTILGDQLLTAESFDFETKASYEVRIETNDGNGGTFSDTFTITVNDIFENQEPTAITLSANTVGENSAVGTVVATLTSSPVDAEDTFTYTLVAGTGDTDNASFTISGDQLLTNAVFDFEAKSNYILRIETNDGNGGTFSDTFTITINNILENQNVTGIISSNTTWRAANSPYNITGNITVNPGIILTIEPGVTINYKGNYRIQVKGGIISNGTISNPIIFNGNTTIGIEKMILFRNAYFNNSSFKYCNFNGPQNAIQLADEASGAEDSPKNSGILIVENSNFINSGLLMKGWGTGAELKINNSTFSNSIFKGEYASENITLNNCTVDKSIFNLNQTYSYKVYNSIITNSFFNINYTYQTPSLLIDTSKIYNTPFSGYDGPVVINKSIIVDSPINLPQNNIDITNSVISFDGTVTPTGIFTRKATISNSIISGRGAGTGIEINGISQSAITNSLFIDNNKGIRVLGTSGTFDFQSNNFIKNKTFAIENLTTRYIDAPNNFWDVITETEIENLIFHYNDDDTKGTVTYTPFLASYQTNALIAPPNNVAKKQVGSDVVLTWTANTETAVVGYKLYYGEPTGYSYSNVIDLGNVTTYTVSGGLIDTEYAITAYDVNMDGVNDQIDGFESWFSVAKDPKVTLSFAGGVLNENSGIVKIKATLSAALPYDTTVNLAIAGTATLDSDYTLSSNAIIIPAGLVSGSADITILTDNSIELTETIIIDIESVDNATEDGEQQVTLTIENVNKPTITLVTSETTIAENESFTITATIDTPISKDVTIDLESVGSALYDTDYTSNSAIRISTVAGGNGPGYNANQLYNPNSVVVDLDGNTFVGDHGNGRIQKWKPGAIVGETVINGLNGYEMDFVIHKDGDLYVMEHGTHQVLKFRAGETTSTVIAGGNGAGPAPNQLQFPRGIFVDNSGNLYIADSDNHRIQKWTTGATEGITVAGGNGAGTAANQLNSPFAVHADSEGNLYIADTGNRRIQKWEQGATTGTTIINNFYPSDIYVNDNGAIYVCDKNNHQILKFPQGSTPGFVVAGGNNAGNNSNQLSSPRKIFVDKIGNIYIADHSNNRVQKYELTPQIIIKAGETEKELIVSGSEDTLIEFDETITFDINAINGVLSNTNPVSVELIDINEPPTVEFTFSNERISENSDTDVVLTATLSSVTEKDVAIDFTMEGSAVETAEYTVDTKSIFIQAHETTGTISISTKGLDDALVEVLDSIVFKVNNITNAAALFDSATLFLESDDNPNVVVTISRDTIFENESFNLTATIDAATSNDVIIDLESLGTANYSDYITNSENETKIVAGGNGWGSAANQISNSSDVFVDADGNVYVNDSDNYRIQKWGAGANKGITVAGGNGYGSEANQLSYSSGVYVDVDGTVYVADQSNHRVQKWLPGALVGITVAGITSSPGNGANQLSNPSSVFVDVDGNIYVADQSNHRIQKWEPGASEGITVAGESSVSGTSSSQFMNPRDVFVDASLNIYVADSGNNRVQKWALGASEGITVAGVTGSEGNEANLLSYPSSIFVDLKGAIYIADPNNNRVQKWEQGATSGITVIGGGVNEFYPNSIFVDEAGRIYVSGGMMMESVLRYQITPQIVVKAGTVEKELVVSGVEDTLDEFEETIIFNTTATNAVLTGTDSFSVILNDINEPPTVSLSLSQEKIVENSETDVILTATLSNISDKDIDIEFLLEGNAVEIEEYIVNTKNISILANQPSGTITISTKDIDDLDVEFLDSIVFSINTITNAIAPLDNATLYLESDDDPNVVITTSKDSIGEHDTFNIIATLDYATSKDVTVGLESIGTAIYDVDFTSNTVIEISTIAGGNGQGGAQNQLYYPRGVFVDTMGNIYVADISNARIQKWASGATEGITVLGGVNPIDIYVDSDGTIFLLESNNQRVKKFVSGDTNGIVVAGGNGQGQAANQLNNPQGFFVDKTGNIYIADYENHRIQKWMPDATVGVTVAGGNGQGGAANQLYYPRSVTVDVFGNIYTADSNSVIKKWAPSSIEGTNLLWVQDASDISIDINGFMYIVESNNHRVQKHNINNLEAGYEGIYSQGVTVAGGNGYGSEANQLYNPQGLYVDNTGNIYVADTQNQRIQKYQTTPQIIVKAGETEGVLKISGIEDELNDEGDEYIVIKKTGVQNAILNGVEDVTITLLDNTKTIALKSSPFMGLSEGAVSWGDYDRDGDKDVAIMGQSNLLGAVTLLYENVNGEFIDTNQNFAKLYGGDITWVDLNKDGWIDLVVSGFDGTAPQTKVYINNGGTYFEPTNGYGLPKLFSTKMAWGDLDNDGDIDLAISGQDAGDNYVFDVYYKEDTSNNFVKEPLFNREGFINGDLKIVDIDLDGDNDIIYNGQHSSGNPVSGYILNSYIRSTINYDEIFRNKFDTSNYWESFNYKNSSIEVAKLRAGQSNHLSIISSGEDSNGTVKLFINDYVYGDGMTAPDFPLLKNGAIAIADFNNDGTNDIVFTGENQEGVPVTKLFKQNATGGFKDSEIELKGLRESTATWVDFDMDGDLDLFLTGIGSSGAETLLYETEITNKKNAAPEQITGLVAEDLGNGKIRFKWDLPSDDYATNLGYVLRVGTTPSGTELSNTESDLITGIRLISKAPPIYTNFYDMQLDPGNYYWSVQAVDPGLKGGVFSEEDAFTLAYEWKILNQGGIVDRSIQGVADPVIKLADVDNDNDLDIIYGSESSYEGAQLLKFDGKQLVKDNSSPLNYVQKITNSEVGDINGDGITDILINHWVGSNYQLKIYLSNGSGYSERTVGNGLYKAKARIIDLNNDGQAEIFLVGMSSSSISGIPKLNLYEYVSASNSFIFTDVSSQIEPLQYASYDLGDIDNDQDIDFIISGFNASTGIKSFIYENVTELGGEFTLKKTTNNLVAVKNGTTDLIDFDGDGDLDAVFTGESKVNDVFEIYMNKLNEGIQEWPRLANGLSPMREGKIDLGDFDGDGYTDLLYSGTFEGTGDITRLSEYDADTKTYVESAFDVSDIIKAEVEFGDLDGDGDLDFAIAGKSAETNGGNIFRTYINVRNQSAEVLGSKGVVKRPKYAGKSAAKSAIENTTFTVNNPPSVPIVNDIVFLEGVNGSVDVPLEFSWQAATDDHTPGVGLTYAIKIGTTAGGEEIMSSNSNSNGVKKDAEKGNVEHNLKWKLSLPEGTYYWSVQAVDASYSGSEFTTPVQFKVTASGIDSDSDGDGVENGLDTCPNTPKGDAVDQNGCSVNALLGDSNGDLSVNVTDLVLNVNYILGLNPIPFVFKAADVNNDAVINVLDIVATVDLILSPASKNNNSKDGCNYYPNNPIDIALFYWEGNDLYVSSNEAIAGMQLVFDTDFDYEISEKLSNFDLLNFKKEADKTVMIYSFSGISIEPGKTKLLTKFDNNEVGLNVEKSAAGTPKGMKLAVKFENNGLITPTESFKLGPNPSNGFMTLYHYLPEERDLLLVKAYNLNGVMVWSSDKIKSSLGQGVNPINLEFLNEGVYFLLIEAFKQGEVKENEVKQIIIRK